MTARPVVYIAAGDPFQPSEGMDVVARAHLQALLAEGPVEVFACHYRRPPDPAGSGLDASGPDHFQGFVSDLASASSRWRRLAIKVAHLVGGGYLPSIGFASQAARAALRARLRQGATTIVVEHLHAVVNLSLSELSVARRGGSRVVFVSHDFTFDAVMDEVRTAGSGLRKLVLLLRARQALRIERRLMRLADCTVFISEYDRHRAETVIGVDPERYQAILPQIAADTFAHEDVKPGGPLLFVGAPSHYPNKMALEWIVQRFAPAFRGHDGTAPILLIGKGTETYSDGNLGIEGLGFVDSARLEALLRSAGGMLCPIEHGSGIKIKLLDAVTRGCPVFATSFSLRGYEKLSIPTILFADDPLKSAIAVQAALLGHDRTQRFAQLTYERYRSGDAIRFGQIVRQSAQS